MEWLITNRKMFKTEEAFLNRLEEVSKKKVGKIILREKDLSNEEFEKLYLKIKEKIKDDCTLIINSNIDIYKKYKEEYLHLPFREFLKYEKIQNEKVGVSIHSLEEGIEA
ncbi:MAG: thiamine phosphate synthase, partial [Clostridium sp.]|uniref:thiamine phosphate synthase n=1 Tax=Clostridium sp. TaxID=1506 RepID=UPI003F326A3D